MKKEELIKHIKNFIPWDCSIELKQIKNQIISVKKKLFLTKINISPVYLKADKSIISDIIYFIKNYKNNKDNISIVKQRLSLFYEKNKIKKSTNINHKFKNKDLFLFYNEVLLNIKKEYPSIDFSDLNITWGRSTKNRTRSIRFGSYDKIKKIVRLHPNLDKTIIPDFFVKSIIYHEIAHHIYFILYPDSKSIHNKIFYGILKKIDTHYYISQKWEKENKIIFFR